MPRPAQPNQEGQPIRGRVVGIAMKSSKINKNVLVIVKKLSICQTVHYYLTEVC